MSNTPKQQQGPAEGARDRSTYTGGRSLVAALMALSVATGSVMASAQPAPTPAGTPSAAPNAGPAPTPATPTPLTEAELANGKAELFPVKSHQELAKLLAFVEAYWGLKVNEKFAAAAQDAVSKTTGAMKNVKKADRDELDQVVKNLFKSVHILQTMDTARNGEVAPDPKAGHMVSAEMLGRMTAFLTSKGCTNEPDKKDACLALFAKTDAVITELIKRLKAEPGTDKDTIHDAEVILEQARRYKTRGIDGLVLLYGAIAAAEDAATPGSPNQPLPGVNQALIDAQKAAQDAREALAAALANGGGGNNGGGSSYVGQPGCMKPVGSNKWDCGVVTKDDATGVTIDTTPQVQGDPQGDASAPRNMIGNTVQFCPGTAQVCAEGNGNNGNQGAPKAAWNLSPVAKYMHIFTDGQTSTNLGGIGFRGSYTFKTIPLDLHLEPGFMVGTGGLASEYTEATAPKLGYLQGGLGYRHRFEKLRWLGLDTELRGVVTTYGGGGANAAFGPRFYAGENFAIAPRITGGYMDMNHEGGFNPWVDGGKGKDVKGANLGGEVLVNVYGW